MTITNLIIAEHLAEHLNAQESLTHQPDWYYSALYAVEGALDAFSEAEARAYVTGCHTPDDNTVIPLGEHRVEYDVRLRVWAVRAERR
jgi:hypothetical protein